MAWLELVGVAFRTILCHPVIQLKSPSVALGRLAANKKPRF